MARIGREHEHLDLVRRAADGRLTATVAAVDLRASHDVEPHYEDGGYGDLVEYLSGLQDAWRGWTGARAWSSLEGELSLRAVHTGSHVVLDVELRHGSWEHGAAWTTTVALTLDAGEELSSAVAATTAELGGTH